MRDRDSETADGCPPGQDVGILSNPIKPVRHGYLDVILAQGGPLGRPAG